jgi:hypothetical protein
MKKKWMLVFVLLFTENSLRALPKYFAQFGKPVNSGYNLLADQRQKVDLLDKVFFYHEKLHPRELLRMQFEIMNLERQALEAAEIYA